jgi:hypothetical protein
MQRPITPSAPAASGNVVETMESSEALDAAIDSPLSRFGLPGIGDDHLEPISDRVNGGHIG